MRHAVEDEVSELLPADQPPTTRVELVVILGQLQKLGMIEVDRSETVTRYRPIREAART